ncbi:MAG: MBL fold metallo-hydrolase [Paracoccaceae bacterium]|nr:MAG: MBL fold metallo-hydrolase [Paracoccaceae bacterium]
MITRRLFCAAGGAAMAMAAGPGRVWAQASLDLGDYRLDTLGDGNLVLPPDFLFGTMPQDELATILARHGMTADSATPPCNVTLLRDGSRTILFDTGAGPDFQPSAGKLPEALQAIGLAPGDVTHVIFTHGHPDHLWGLLDEFDEPVFANAEHMIGGSELDYWTDPATVARIGEARASFAVGAARRLGAIAGGLRRLSDGETVLPGIVARLTPGHTPGHLAFEVGQGGAAAMVAGDALGNHHVAFERPDWLSGADQDAAMAAATRRRLLSHVAGAGMWVVGFHFPGQGIGRAEPQGDAYAFRPA